VAVCTRCGKEIDPAATQCIHCGKDLTLESAGIRCPKCSSRNPANATSCSVCKMVFQTTAEKPTIVRPRVVAVSTPKSVPKPSPPKPIPPKSEEPPIPVQPAVPESAQALGICIWCGNDISPSSVVCPNCNRDLTTGHYQVQEAIPQSDYRPYQQAGVPSPYSETSAPAIAGLLLTLGGVFALGQGMIYMIANEPLGGIGLSSIGANCCGAIILILGIIGLIGGKFASDRKHLMLTLLACVAIMLTFTLYVIGPFFGLVAMLLIWISRYDFETY